MSFAFEVIGRGAAEGQKERPADEQQQEEKQEEDLRGRKSNSRTLQSP